ncbi:hypothetical protein [Weissella viridescens]|uniref:hypothetical protein n=1 Tax=Weissella viridescens TaxID=1629 RepID=UPI004056224C
MYGNVEEFNDLNKYFDELNQELIKKQIDLKKQSPGLKIEALFKDTITRLNDIRAQVQKPRLLFIQADTSEIKSDVTQGENMFVRNNLLQYVDLMLVGFSEVERVYEASFDILVVQLPNDLILQREMLRRVAYLMSKLTERFDEDKVWENLFIIVENKSADNVIDDITYRLSRQLGENWFKNKQGNNIDYSTFNLRKRIYPIKHGDTVSTQFSREIFRIGEHILGMKNAQIISALNQFKRDHLIRIDANKAQLILEKNRKQKNQLILKNDAFMKVIKKQQTQIQDFYERNHSEISSDLRTQLREYIASTKNLLSRIDLEFQKNDDLKNIMPEDIYEQSLYQLDDLKRFLKRF